MRRDNSVSGPPYATDSCCQLLKQAVQLNARSGRFSRWPLSGAGTAVFRYNKVKLILVFTVNDCYPPGVEVAGSAAAKPSLTLIEC